MNKLCQSWYITFYSNGTRSIYTPNQGDYLRSFGWIAKDGIQHKVPFLPIIADREFRRLK